MPIGRRLRAVDVLRVGAGAVVLAAVLAPARPARADAPPVGHFEQVAIGVDGEIVAHGWAYDPDAPGAEVVIHVYVDGVLSAYGAADRDRPDVDAAFGVGVRHGFAVPLSLRDGRHEVCAFAIDVASENQGNPSLGCADLTVDQPSSVPDPLPVAPPPPPSTPVGWVDALVPRSDGSGFALRGWAYDPGDPDRTVDIHVYRGDTLVSARRASASRPDVDRALGGIGDDHGFDFSAAVRIAGGDAICVWAIGAAPAPNALLGCRDVGPTPDQRPPANITITPDSGYQIEIIR